jgi:ABC-type Na+ transport system ATPase subunit NatA
VSDERSYHRRLTARRNLKFSSMLHGTGRANAWKRIEEVSELLNLREFLDQHFSDLSSGMRQKVAIARGRSTTPDPFNGRTH